jgi:hypothetical protein
MHLCKKVHDVASADTARLTRFMEAFFVCSCEPPSPSADSNTIMCLPCFTRAFRHFLLRHPTSGTIDFYDPPTWNIPPKCLFQNEGTSFEAMVPLPSRELNFPSSLTRGPKYLGRPSGEEYFASNFWLY